MSQACFADKTILATGAGRGLGEAIARRFASEAGAGLLVGSSREPLETLVATIKQAGRRAGLGAIGGCLAGAGQVQAVVDAALARWGRIDVLVNNAGVVDDETPFLEMTEAQWDRVLDINLKGCFLLSQTAARAMVPAGGGVNLQNASIAGLNTDGPYANYCASKAGLLAAKPLHWLWNWRVTTSGSMLSAPATPPLS